MTTGVQPEPLVSVVVPAYNAGRYIRESLQSIASQRGDFTTEIIVVDDGSTDDTHAQVVSFGEAKLITQKNAGPSAARNRGIAAALGEYIAFLDADDLWTPGKLAIQMRIFHDHPDLGMVLGDCRRFDDSGPRPASFFEEAGLDLNFWGDPVVVQNPYAKLFQINYVPTGSVVLARQALRVSGTFDESKRFVEDMDLWLRIARHLPVGYTRYLCQLKRQHGENLSNDTRAMDLAYLEVLNEQRRLYGEQIKRLGIPLRQKMAYQYCLIGERCEHEGLVAEARGWYLKGLCAHPSLRPAYYLLRILGKGASERRT